MSIQSTLFETDRPTSNTPAVVDAAWRELETPILAWLKSNGESEIDDEERARIREQVLDALSGHNDGYEAARDLDRWHSWSADRDLVDILDGWQSHIYSAVHKAELEWVKANGVQPTYKLGDHVAFWSGGEAQTGEIVKVDTESARYTIQRPGDGVWKGGQKTIGAVVAYDKVRSLIDGDAA